MEKTVFEVYELYVEIRKSAEPEMGAEQAKKALAGAYMDDEKPVAEFEDAAAAAGYIRGKGTGSIDDFGTYWRVHGWICWETDKVIEDGEETDRQSIGTCAVSEF